VRASLGLHLKTQKDSKNGRGWGWDFERSQEDADKRSRCAASRALTKGRCGI